MGVYNYNIIRKFYSCDRNPVNICIFKIIHRKLQQLSEDFEPPLEQAEENPPDDTVL